MAISSKSAYQLFSPFFATSLLLIQQIIELIYKSYSTQYEYTHAHPIKTATKYTKQQIVKKYLPQAVELCLNSRVSNSEELTKQERVIITKIYKNLNTICKLNVKQLKEIIKIQPQYQAALGDLYFDKKINNYILITNYEKVSSTRESPLLEIQTLKHANQAVSIEYKIQFTISNIAKKKVMKPVILLMFLLKNGTKLCLYFSVQQFALLRAEVASSMRQIFGVQLRTL